MKILSAVATIIFFAVGATAQTTNDLSDAEIQGRQLARQLCEQKPDTNYTQTGVLIVRGSNKVDLPIEFEARLNTDDWFVDYETTSGSNRLELMVFHEPDKTNRYFLFKGLPAKDKNFDILAPTLSNSKIILPFAGSDFWICDLGLEFFHWPEQKLLRKEVKRSRGCSVLESTNPNPFTNGYSRVVSWIDNETLGIVHAEAYDSKNKLLKEFDPKSFKKVSGQWELQEMEIRNDQTGSRSRLELDVKKE
jgi:hypothetical protein